VDLAEIPLETSQNLMMMWCTWGDVAWFSWR